MNDVNAIALAPDSASRLVQSQPAQWALGELSGALRQAGVEVLERGEAVMSLHVLGADSADAVGRAAAAGLEVPRAPESFALLRSGNDVVAIGADPWHEPGWSTPATPEDVLARFPAGKWSRHVRDLMGIPEQWMKWALAERPVPRHWGEAQITLLGDAAHPMLPFLAQGAAMAIEDGAVLAARLAATPDDPAAAMRRYEQDRRARVAKVQRAALDGTPDDLATVQPLLAVLEQKAGRVLVNGFPTGVEVCPSMNHGGPYPATSDVRFTSVGTAAMLRFARPVCYQGLPDSLLPDALKNKNPQGIMRLVNSQLTRDAI